MFDIKIIESGCFLADGGAMFGAIPKRAWQRKYPSVGDNLCKLAMRCIFVISEKRKILIDLGMGDKHLAQVDYYQPGQLLDIADALDGYGYKPTDITDVILTHLHFDHCGYATINDEQGNPKPTFPNAKYWLSQKQWDNSRKPNRLEKDSMFDDNIVPVKDAGLLYLVDEDMLLCEGLEIRLFDGHTTGQLVVYIETGNGTTVFPGDLVPTAAHVPLEWISAYDVCAQTSLNEKERFLEEAVRKHYTLVYYHDAITVSSKVKAINDNYISVDKLKR